MRILHVTNAFPYPEVPEYGIFVKEQIESLREQGVECDTLFVNGREVGKKAYLSSVPEIRRRAKAADLVHCHHLYTGLAASLAMTGKPRVVSFQNDWLREVEINSHLAQVVLCSTGVRLADKVIFKSPIPGHLASDARCVHLPNGVDFSSFGVLSKAEARELLGLDPEAIYLLFVSSKSIDRPQKRYDRFQSALAGVRATFPARDVRELVLVNEPRDRAIAYFSAADVHVLTSDFEGSPNSVKESLASGTPVVATAVGNVMEMVADIPGCCAVNLDESADISRRIVATIAAPPPRDTVREAFLGKGFGREETAIRLKELYASLI